MTSREEPLSAARICHVYRQLAEEHAKQREPSSREVSWRLVQARLLGERGRSRQRRRVAALWAAAAAALIALGVSVWSLTREGALEYRVEGASVEGGVIRTDDRTATLAFSDDSVIEVDPHSTLSVAVQGPHRAEAFLTRGRLRVQVKHDAETDWRFVAGPHEIRVVGTRFDLEWRPEVRRFSIVMHEGRVLVTGGERPATTLSAGQILVVEPRHEAGRSQPSTPEAAAEPAPVATEAAKPEPRGPRSAPATWSELVARGRFAEVVQAAERLGLDAVLRDGSEAELKALAQAARYTGRGALAVRAWRALRARSSGETRAQAAFFLGRSYESTGTPAQAIRSYDDYLRDPGSGVYAAEALGRKLLLLARDDGPRARAVARQYLRRFPQGAYAPTARDILAGE